GRVEEEVLPRLRPSRLQLALLERLYGIVRGRLEGCRELSRLGGEWRVTLQGSMAKGTMLSDKWEIDVFVLVDGGREAIGRWGEKVLRRCLRGLPIVVRYSEHPYVTVAMMGLQADVVPAPKARSPAEARGGVERTPFHTEYVASRISRRPCLADDVRLLKSFLKALEVYGAETHIAGFSGYVAELLVIAYGGFRGVLREAARWRPPVYVDPEGVGDEGALRRRYRDSPLIVVDPVDPERNAAAAVSTRSLATLVLASRVYLERPTQRLFHLFLGKPRYKPMPGVAVVLYGDFYLHPPEAVWGRLKRLADGLYRVLTSRGYPAVYRSFWTDEATIAAAYVHMPTTTTPKLEARGGPEAWARVDRVLGFVEKRVVEGGWLWVGDDGSIRGARPSRLSGAAFEAERALEGLAKPPGYRGYMVVECTWPSPCGLPGPLEELRDPTPRWLRAALEEG
ncbi:MAG: CCA tRNA nucleotidyltransferase, partial [Desulfurococcales archaeon]|nr:CCA tRNA nucleotidyltransferase [Desulfurococcales archaeon]